MIIASLITFFVQMNRTRTLLRLDAGAQGQIEGSAAAGSAAGHPDSSQAPEADLQLLAAGARPGSALHAHPTTHSPLHSTTRCNDVLSAHWKAAFSHRFYTHSPAR